MALLISIVLMERALVLISLCWLVGVGAAALAAWVAALASTLLLSGKAENERERAANFLVLSETPTVEAFAGRSGILHVFINACTRAMISVSDFIPRGLVQHQIRFHL